MDWLQVLTLIGSNFAFILTLWLWNRSESRDDHKNLENRVFMVVSSIQEDVKAIHQEIKDFHGRLCTIEERNKK